MAEIEILFPTVQYGNVKLRATPEELGLEGPADAYALGVQSAVLLNLFTQGFKTGSQLDVSASQEAPPGDPQAAADRLADGRSPRTVDEANAMAAEVIKQELGATEVDEDSDEDESPYPNEDITPPWEKDSTVDTKKKPWENGSVAPKVTPKVAEIDWS